MSAADLWKREHVEKIPMKVSHIKMGLPPIRVVRQSLVKEILWRHRCYGDRLSYWQIILLQSKVNGCLYRGEDLAETKWEWPKDTWFQARLNQHVKNLELGAERGST